MSSRDSNKNFICFSLEQRGSSGCGLKRPFGFGLSQRCDMNAMFAQFVHSFFEPKQLHLSENRLLDSASHLLKLLQLYPGC
jgi:hypothetical protein